MNRDAAMRYAKAWADRVRVDIGELEDSGGGGFHGDLGAPEVEFDADAGVLIVRGMVFRSAAALEGRAEVPPLLEEANARDAGELAGGKLELATTPAHAEEGAWLSLRRDFDDPAMPEGEFIDAVQALMSAAYTWRRTKLMPLLDEANRQKAG